MKKIVRGFAGGLALTQMLTPFAIALESSENIKITLTDNVLVKGNKLVGAKNGKIKLESKKTDISKLFVVKEEIYNKYLSDLTTSDEPDKIKESFVLEHSLKGNEYSFKDDGIYVFGFIEEEKIKEEIENEDGTTEDIEKVNYTISKDQVVTYSETKFSPSLDLDIVGANKLIDSVYKFSNELVLTSKVESDTKTEGKIFIVEKGEEFDRDSSKFQKFNPETDEKVKLQNLPIDKEFKVFVLITDEVGNEFIKTSSTYEKLDIQTTVPVSKDIWSKDKHTVKVDLSKLDKKDIDSVSIDILNKGSKIDTIDSTASIGSIETINLNDIKENIGGNVSIRVNLKTVLGTDSKETTFYIDDTAPKLVESSFNAKGALVNKHGDLYLEEPLVLDILVSDKEEGKETSGLDYLQIEHRTQDKIDVLKKTNKENLSINLPENLTGELYIVAEDKYGNKLEQKVEPLRIEGKTRPDFKYKLVKGDTKVTLEDKKVLSDKYFSNKENSDLYGMEFTVKIDTPDLDEIILNVNDVKTVISSDRVKDGLLTITDEDIKTQRISATDKLKIDIEVADFTSKKDSLTLFEGTIDSIAPIVTIGSTDLDNYEVIDGVLYVKEDKTISIDIKDEQTGIQSKTLNGKDFNRNSIKLSELTSSTRLEVVDNAGNKTIKTIKDFINVDEQFSSVKIVDENLTITNTTKNEIIEGYYKDLEILSFDLESNDSLLKEVKYEVLDKNGDKKKGSTITVDPVDKKHRLQIYIGDIELENGYAEVNIETTSILGTIETKTFKINFDNANPTIKETKIENGIEFSDDLVFINGNKTNINVTLEDEETFVEKVILEYKEDLSDTWKEVQTKTLSKDNQTTNFEIKDSGFYKITVIDLVGHKTEKELEQVIFDATVPQIEISKGLENVTIINDENWFVNKPTFEFDISDDNLKDMEVFINDKKVDTVKFNSKETEYKYILSPENVDLFKENDKNTIEVVVKDKSKNVSKEKIEFTLDNKGPNISDTIKVIQGIENDYGITDKEKVVLKFNIEDLGSGIDKVMLNDKYEVINGEVTLLESLRRLNIKATDKLGNTSEKVFDVNILIDNEKPETSIDLKDKEPTVIDKKEWLKEPTDFIFKASDASGLKNIKIKANGNVVNSVDKFPVLTLNQTFNIKFEQVEKYVKDNKLDLEFEVEDLTGNKSYMKKTYYVDLEGPEDLMAIYNKELNVYPYGVFSNKPIDITLHAKDKGVGLDSMFANGTILENNKLVISEENLEGHSLYIQAKDKLGHMSEVKNLNELNDMTKDSENRYYIDSIDPIVTTEFIDNSVIKTDKDGKVWFNNDLDYIVNVKDNLSIAEVLIKVNGKEVRKFNAQGITKNKQFTLNSSDYEKDDYKFEVETIVKDSAGNETSKKDIVYIDKEAPTDVTTIFNNIRIHNYGIFSKTPIKTEISAKDSGSGVKDVFLNGVKLKNNTLEITDELYNPLIVVSDYVNNKTKDIPLNTLDDKTKNTDNIFIVDNIKPTIDIKKPKADYDGKWYNKDIDFNINVKDNKALDKINVKVNNKIVKTFDAKEITKEKDFTISTKDYTPGTRGSYQVQVDVIDAAGNENSLKETVYIDKEAPVNLKASVSGKDVNIYEYGIFSKEPFEVQLSADDKDGSGLSHFNINGVRNEKGLFKISENTKSIMISAEDNVNNKTDEIALNKLDGDLSKNKNNHFYIDNVKPSINLKNNTSSKPDYQNTTEKWYNKHQNFTVDVKDNLSLREVKIKINGKEEVKVFNNKNGLETDYSYSFNTRDYINKIDGKDVGGKVTIEVLVTDSAGNTSKTTEELYIDNVKPTVKKFTFLSNGIKEGVQTNGNADYGFYFKTSTDVELDLTDYITVNGTEYKQGNYSSGLARVDYVLKNTNGQNIRRSTSNIINGNKVIITVPIDFKGTIEAIAYDNVNHASNSNSPSGVITESSNWHINSSRIDLNEPNTPYKDRTGKKLYNKDTSIGLFAKQSSSGIRQIKWGIDDKTIETVSVDNKGNISNGRFKGQKLDRNLITEITSSLLVSENRNDIKIWTEVTSRTGRISKRDTSISIDKDAPIIDVTYNTTKDKYYNTDRVANITIKERNFNPDDVKITGKAGTLGTWRNNGDVWTNTMTFSQDGVYKWGLEYTDMAGNPGKPYNSEEFVIDKTKPIMKLTFDNNNKLNGKYYDKGRVGTITITERNFDSSKFTIKGGTISGFRSNGDTHTATVVFNKDGVYSLDLGFTDLAGNKAEDIHVDEFVIDTTKPKTNLLGVSKGQIFYDGINIRFNVSDTNLDVKNSIFTLVNRTTNKQIPLTGSMSNGVISLTGLKNIKENDGVYDLHYTVVDLAGNKVTEDVRFYVNRFGSDFEVDSVDYIGKYVKSLEKDVVIKELSLVKLKDIEITVFKDGTKIEVPKDKIQIKETQLKDGSYSYVYTIDKDFFDEGSFKVEVVSKDINDKTNDTRKTDLEFIVDKTKPTIIVGLDEDELYFTPEKDVIIDISDNYGLDNYKILLNGEEVTGEKISEGKIKITIPATNTKQNLKVVAEDKAGNIEEKEVNFYVTTSNWLQFKNSNFFTATISGLVGLIMLMFFLIFKRKEEEAEEEAQLEAETNAQNEGKEE